MTPLYGGNAAFLNAREAFALNAREAFADHDDVGSAGAPLRNCVK